MPESDPKSVPAPLAYESREPTKRDRSRWSTLLILITCGAVALNFVLWFCGALMTGAGHGDDTLLSVSRYMAVGTGILILSSIASLVAK